ncbi:MAG: RnfABCDGE type electron transport complex subunit B [Phycisphaerae bacterium]|nr:RnfABCDGE type electron transport complex subunit B [Phycisphaerae bacterium]
MTIWEQVGPYLASAWVVLGALAAVFGIVLAVANRFFSVTVDPRQEQIEEALPKANCGACGYGGCAAYAEAIVQGKADANLCMPGGAETAVKIGKIMGLAVAAAAPKVAVVKCQGSCQNTFNRFHYIGQRDCRAAAATQYGQTACPYGCLGFGTCVQACPFDAMVMDPQTGLPRVLEDKCMACGTCAEVCPKNIIEILPRDRYVHVLCRNRDVGKIVRQVCKVGCIACHKCEKVCPVEGGAVHVADNLATVDMKTCISCGKCAQECPVACIGNFRSLRREAKKRTGAAAEAA